MPRALEKKLKHLDFIQLTITRMSANSFLIKAWTITILTAIFALAASSKNGHYLPIGFLPLIGFWLLDGYYLDQERRFRALYDHVRALEEAEIDFSLNTAAVAHASLPWLRALASRTLLVFYGGLLATLSLVIWKVAG